LVTLGWFYLGVGQSLLGFFFFFFFFFFFRSLLLFCLSLQQAERIHLVFLSIQNDASDLRPFLCWSLPRVQHRSRARRGMLAAARVQVRAIFCLYSSLHDLPLQTNWELIHLLASMQHLNGS
jgi:hypothetical protein